MHPSPVLKYLWLPSILQLLFPTLYLLHLPHFTLDPLPRSQHLALQIETATLLRIVDIEELLEALEHILHVGLSALWRLDVQDLTGLLEGHGAARAEGGGPSVASFLLRFLVGGGGGGLLIGFCKGATEHARAGDRYLKDDSVRLRQRWSQWRSSHVRKTTQRRLGMPKHRHRVGIHTILNEAQKIG